MIGHIVAAVVKKVAKEAVKRAVKTVSKEAKKAIIKKVGQLAKKGMETAAKKKARQVIKNIEKIGKGAKKATELIKTTKDFLSNIPKSLKDKTLVEFKDFAGQYEEGQAVIDALDTVKNVSSKVSNPKSAIKSVVQDFLKQAEEDDKRLEDKDETDDLPFDSPEETGEFQVDEKPTEEEEEPDEFIGWYDIPREVRRQIDKDANKGSVYDSDLGDELIQNGFRGAHRSNIQRYIDDNMMMVDF